MPFGLMTIKDNEYNKNNEDEDNEDNEDEMNTKRLLGICIFIFTIPRFTIPTYSVYLKPIYREKITEMMKDINFEKLLAILTNQYISNKTMYKAMEWFLDMKDIDGFMEDMLARQPLLDQLDYFDVDVQYLKLPF